MRVRLVSSPDQSYVEEVMAGLEEAHSFVLVTAFASVAGIEMLAPAIRRVVDLPGRRGRIVLAVDRQSFNATPVFDALLALKASCGARLSIGVLLDRGGLLHAKALFTEGPRGDQLLVGSANLTRGAFRANHELGLLLDGTPPDIRRAFLKFVDSIAPRSLDGPDARGFLEAHGLVARERKRVTPEPTTSEAASTLASAFDRLPPLPPLDTSPENHLLEWIRRGYLVGRGRRNFDALVLRLPQEQLVRSGFITPPSTQAIGRASHESKSTGYGVDLIFTSEAELLRKEARRVSLLLSKLAINLPCFGWWIPETYWETFVRVRETLQIGLTPARIRELAVQGREYLLAGGLESQVDAILERLQGASMLVSGKRDLLRNQLLQRFRQELRLRTPDVLASCIEFRTARQLWSPFEQTEAPFRQLMVDIVQATFSATYRTGDWPRRFRSHAARQIADAIGNSLAQTGRQADGDSATEILDQSSTWEDDARPMADVIEEFRRLVPDQLEFSEPDLNLEDDEGGDDDDIR